MGMLEEEAAMVTGAARGRGHAGARASAGAGPVVA
jgi:NAD(P)-dependent dehydrogenase (short-subunit alcohol dehydrogenase family)